MKKKASLEQNIQELENILETLSNENTLIDSSFNLYNKGIDLYTTLQQQIQEYQVKIQILKNKEEVLNASQDPLLEEY